jgi:hypothetical protein
MLGVALTVLEAKSNVALPSRRAKSIGLIGGFVFATLGALWSFLVVERLSEQARELANAKADVNRQIQSLNTLAAEYFIANQQGDLIFILAQQENARRDLASLIYQGNILDRATPVRNMIGALAVARQLDYKAPTMLMKNSTSRRARTFRLRISPGLSRRKRTLSSKDKSASPCFSINSSKSNERLMRTKLRRRSSEFSV